MDLIPRNVNENDPDLNRIQNLSLEGHNQKLDLGKDELKKQFKTSFGDDGSMSLKPNSGNLPCWSPTSPCMCRGPRVYYPVEPWASPDPKLYWTAEDPTRKKYSPLEAPSPRKYTRYFTSNVQKDDANSN